MVLDMVIPYTNLHKKDRTANHLQQFFSHNPYSSPVAVSRVTACLVFKLNDSLIDTINELSLSTSVLHRNTARSECVGRTAVAHSRWLRLQKHLG